MGFYDGIEKEDAATDRGAFMRAGHYLAQINRVRSGHSDKHSCDYAAIDMTILHVFNDGEKALIASAATPKEWVEDPKGAHRAGENVSVQFMSKHLSAKRNYKAFLANAVGVPEGQVDPAFCAQVESDELLAGEVIELNNRVIALKSEAPFTKVWAIRAVPASEFSKTLDETVVARFYPEGFDTLIEAETA